MCAPFRVTARRFQQITFALEAMSTAAKSPRVDTTTPAIGRVFVNPRPLHRRQLLFASLLDYGRDRERGR
jgi:hypothetical protein